MAAPANDAKQPDLQASSAGMAAAATEFAQPIAQVFKERTLRRGTRKARRDMSGGFGRARLPAEITLPAEPRLVAEPRLPETIASLANGIAE